MKVKTTKQDDIAAAAKESALRTEKTLARQARSVLNRAKRAPGVVHIKDWLAKAAFEGGQLDAPIAKLKAPERMIFKNSSKTDFANFVPSVFAEEKHGSERVIFSGSATAEKMLKNQSTQGSVKFGSFLNRETPPLFLGSIADMKNVGFDDFFISMILQPRQFTADSRAIRTRVLYSLLAKSSPMHKELRSFEDNLKASHKKSEIKKALNELLIDASALEKPFLVELLLREGADPNARSWLHGVSAINVAYNKGRKEIAHLLVDYGANPNVKETYPMSDTESYQPKKTRLFAEAMARQKPTN